MQGGTNGSHQEGGRDAFAGDVADGHTQAPVLEGNEVVVVPTNLLRSAAEAGEIDSFDQGVGSRTAGNIARVLNGTGSSDCLPGRRR